MTCSDGRGYRSTKEQCNEKAETEPHGGIQGVALAALKGDRTLA